MSSISLETTMWPIVGHQQVIDLLQRSINKNRIAHAYLFSGPPQIGKTSIAIAFAQALNCQGSNQPCGECCPCRLIAANKHPDVRLIQLTPPGEDNGISAKGGERVIGIEQIRSLQHDAALLPYEGRWKVYIILNVEHMSDEAANCLLKTLEEPPPQVVLLLTTVDSGLLWPTVVSRCQVIPLHPLPSAEIKAALEQQWQVDDEEAHRLASLATGRIGWAISAVLDPIVLQKREEQLNWLLHLVGSSRVDRFAYAEQLAGQFAHHPETVKDILRLWLGWWQDLLLAKGGCAELAANADRADILSAQAQAYDFDQLLSFLRAINTTLEQLDQNVNPRLALETLLLNIPKR